MRSEKTMSEPQAGTRRRRRTSLSRAPVDLGVLSERVGYFLRRAQLAVFQDFHAHFYPLDIRPAQYSVLTIVESNPGLSQSRVCETLGIKKANIVPLVDELEARGLLSRVAADGDRRSYALTLTGKGKILVRKLHKIADRHEQRFVEMLGAQAYARLFESLEALTKLQRAEA